MYFTCTVYLHQCYLFFQGLTGGREISHVLAFIFTFMLKNSFLSDALKSEYNQKKNKNDLPERRGGGKSSEKKIDPSSVVESNHCGDAYTTSSSDTREQSHNKSCFKYEPSINPSLEDIFAPLIHRNAKSISVSRGSSAPIPQTWMQMSGSKSSSLSSCHSGRRLGKKRRKRYTSCIPLMQSDSEVEESQKTSRLGKALVKFTMNPNDFDYFTRAVYSDEDKCHCIGADQMSDLASEICLHDSIFTISQVELLQCIISLQIQLTMHEAELKHLSSPLLTTHDILQFSLDSFTSMVSELEKLENRRTETIQMQVVLTGMLKLLFSSVQRFLKCSKLLLTVIELHIVPKLLSLVTALLNDICNQDDGASASDNFKNILTNQLDIIKASLAHETVVGLLLLLQSCTYLKIEGKDAWQYLHLHKIFLQNNGSEIVKNVVFLQLLLPLYKRVEVLNSLSKLVLCLKYWQEDIYHMERCDKKNHRFCEYHVAQHHHSQVFGSCSIVVETTNSGTCMISNFVCVLLDCFAGSTELCICPHVVKAMSKCGICCCMNVRMILSKLLDGPLVDMAHVISHISLFIENIVWRDLSGMVPTDSNNCIFCRMSDYHRPDSFTYCMKGKGLPHHFKNYRKEELDENILDTVSHWEGIVLYKKNSV